MIMKKKQYIFPLTEVTTINLSGVILTSPGGGDSTPLPPVHPGAYSPRPRIAAPVF